ncbi:MAG: gliding motility-associated C-terminal domain-containing protein [Flavobacteriaceae bacterium]
MEKITFVKYRSIMARYSSLIIVIYVLGSTPSFGNTSVYNFRSIHEENILDKAHVIGTSNIEEKISKRFWDLFSIGNLYLSTRAVDKPVVFTSSADNQINSFSLALKDISMATPVDTDGDGVTNDKENEDGTDPNDPCDFILAHQNCSPSSAWKNADCDGDGVTNGKEKEDGTDSLDPCDFVLAHQNCSPSSAWKNADCDGDGVTNGKEKEDGTDSLDPCDFVLAHQNCSPSMEWKNADCDGDGVTNGKEKEDGTDPLDSCDLIYTSISILPSYSWKKEDCDGDGVTNWKEVQDETDPTDPCDYKPESITLPQNGDYLTVDCDGDGVTNGDEKEDGTDPLDPCDYNPESVTLTPTVDWEVLDCDNDGNPNGTDPDPLVATARDDSGSTPALTEVAINILENDDYLPNNHPDNLGITTLSTIGGSALGGVVFDEDTGFLTYTPIESESNTTVTIIYQVCNVIPDPNVCASATVTIQVGPDINNVIDVVDDSYSVETGVSGVIPDSNVLGNDTINGEAVAATDVVITSTPTDELTINGDGSVSVAPGTADGTYTITYTICEVANTDNCDTGTVTVQVGPDMDNVIDAVDDSYSAETGVSGVIPDSNVLGNDTINGEAVAATDVVITSTPTDELTINGDGSVSVAPGTADGTYTITYTICEVANTDNCDTGTVTVIIEEGDGDEKIEVNQLVTPNSDGKNDFLFIRGVRNANNNTLKIFNRWGVSVYEGKGYNNQNNVFDGRSKARSTVNGNGYLPAGVYYYIFQYENKQQHITDSGYIYVSK